MSYFIMALACAGIGVIPLLLKKRFNLAMGMLTGATLFLWFFFWFTTASIVGPSFGFCGFWVFVLWLIAAIVDTVSGDGGEISIPLIDKNVSSLSLFPVGLLVFAIVLSFASSSVFRAQEYASIIGAMPKKTWSSDMQPTDPKHIRLSSQENAIYRAKNSLTQSGKNYGSQFEVLEDAVTLQKVNGKYWYVVPLDFRESYSVWSSTGAVPGYVMVSAEDDEVEPKFVQLREGEMFKYTPGAYFGYNLERHLRMNGYLSVGLKDFTLEIDESGKAWWVVTTYKPTIVFDGNKITGAVIVDPITGDSNFYSLGAIPKWADRIMPKNDVEQYLKWWGELNNGWWNSFWGKLNLLEPEDPIMVYGADGDLYWVVSMTSKNDKDTSLLGVVYVNSRTGKATLYQTNGGSTNKAIEDAVLNNKDVSYKKLHPVHPQLYNLYDNMVSVMPLLNDSHARQGVAIVNVLDIQKVAIGNDFTEALRAYQALMGSRAMAILENGMDMKKIQITVDRISQGGIDGKFYIYSKNVPSLFVCTLAISPKVVITKPGDTVSISYYNRGESVMAVISFDNLSIQLKQTENERKLNEQARQNYEVQKILTDSSTVNQRFNKLTPEQRARLLRSDPVK